MLFHHQAIKITRSVGLAILLVFVCFANVGLGSASSQPAGELRKWSFFFQNCTISDALKYLKDHTGINISVDKKITKRVVQKSYKDVDLPFIIRDILTNEDYGMIVEFHEGKLDAINISVTCGDVGNSELSASSELKVGDTEKRIQEIDDHREAQPPRHGDEKVDKSEPGSAMQKVGTSSLRRVANEQITPESYETTARTGNQNEKDLANGSAPSENEDAAKPESKDLKPAKKIEGAEPPPMPPSF